MSSKTVDSSGAMATSQSTTDNNSVPVEDGKESKKLNDTDSKGEDVKESINENGTSEGDGANKTANASEIVNGNETPSDIVVKSEEKPAVSSEKAENHFAVFVMNIPAKASEEDVKEHFEKDKKISVKSVTLVYAPTGKFRGYATVELEDKASYEEALKLMGSKMDTLYLYVVPHRSMNQPQEHKDEAGPYKILVSNISKSVGLIEAKRHFYPAGLIRRFIPRVPGKTPGKDGLFKSDWAATIKVNKMDTFANILKMDGMLIGDQAVKVEPLVLDKRGVFKRLAECPEIGDGTGKKQKLSESDDQHENEPENPLKLFVGNIPHTASSQDVIDHLKKAGEVTKCWMPDEYSSRKRPKIAFVIMADEEGFDKALELTDSTLQESTLKIGPFVRGKGSEGRKIAEQDWLKKPLVVVVSNIPFKINEDDVKKHFESVGTIEKVRFPRDKSLPVAYMELADTESYEKSLELTSSFMGEHCISVLPTKSKLVPKHWLDMYAQQQKRRSQKGRRRGYRDYRRNSRRKLKSKGEHPPMLTPREIRRREKRLRRKQARRDSNFIPTYLKNAHLKPKVMGMRSRPNFGNDNYPPAYSYDLYDRGWNDDRESGSFKRPIKPLGESKRKEIEQVALAALTELEARKSNSYFSGSNAGYGSNYSYESNNAYGSGSTYGSNSSYGMNNNYGSSNPSYGTNSGYGSNNSNYGSSTSYGGNNSSYYYQQH